MSFVTGIRCAVAAGSIALPASLYAGDSLAIMGYLDLLERLGEENVPTGASVRVSQVEAPTGDDNAYGPNQQSSQFTGKTFYEMSGPAGNSGHAQGVASSMYGNNSSMAHGVAEIWLYEASNWLQAGLLRLGQPAIPLAPPEGVRVFNNSWIANISNPAGMNDEALRRADWLINHYDLQIVSGVANSGSGLPLMSHGFNGIAVGRMNGSHAFVPTHENIDVPGRMKPEIVAPASTTSGATPRVSAAVTLLYDTAQTDPDLVDNLLAAQPQVIKATLLTGATHSDAHGQPWTNNPVEAGPERGTTSQPIDEVVGVGTVNINRSHLILTGAQQPASDSADVSATSAPVGWDMPTILAGGSAYWQFALSEPAEEVSIIATWNRLVPSNFAIFLIASVELELWRIDEDGALVSLVGDGGLDWFDAGNVLSNSPIDNIQHLYITGLQAGMYALEARRTDAKTQPWPVAVAWLIDQPEADDEPVFGDLNGDGVVDVFDLLILLGQWGACRDEADCPGDLNGDGIVDVFDLLLLLGNWG